MKDVNTLKSDLISASKKLVSKGLLFRGNHANLSARLDDVHIVMTRGGDVEHLTENSFVIVTLEGDVKEGDITSTNAEVIAMHTGIYKKRKEIGAVIHTHAPNATAFSIAHQEIPMAYEPLLRFGVTDPIPVIEWAPRGSDESVNNILKAAGDNPGTHAVLLANHGVLAFHSNPLQTVDLLATVDEAAELIIKARQLGGEKLLPKEAFNKVAARMKEFEK